MLSQWLKSPTRSHSSSPKFTCSSFKDIQSLISDDSDSDDNHRIAASKFSIFRRVLITQSILRSWTSLPVNPNPNPDPDKDKRIVIYFTSLRVVRRTFDDCRTVRSILKSFRVSIDERDLSMDARFLTELKSMLGYKSLTLPRVFIGGRYVGGADEIRYLHEAGELKKFIDGVPAADSGGCDVCGGYRFVLCEECNGSHKVFSEKSGFRICTDCNENGLIRCSSCCF